MKKILFSLITIIASFSAYGQAEKYLVEEVKSSPTSLDISYKKYVLPNGLKVLIHEDHSDPIVHVEVTYHVGSARESMGKSGFAHLFEHMMFQGSGHVADEEHFKLVQGAGGNMNGTTNRDRTNYFETVPSNNLELALYLESDRMAYILDSLTKEKFEVQRSTVKNEKDQNYGRPYGMVGERADFNLYPYGHPYSWPVIGYTDDLDRVQVEDVRKFFMRWYGANNAVLVIAGDVDATATINMVNKYFGAIPKGPEVQDQKVPSVLLPEEKITNLTDWVYYPLVQMTFPTVPSFHKDEAALDVLAELMAGSKSSLFYKTFIEDRDDYLQASVNNSTSELAGEFTISLVSYPGYAIEEQLKQSRTMAKETINKFGEQGFTDADLARVKKSITVGYYGIDESVAYKGSILSSYETFTNGKFNVQKDMERYNAVTNEDVMRVYNQYIKGKNAAIVQVIPDPKQNIPNQKYKAVESFNQYASVTNDPKDAQYKNLTYNRAKEDFDRTVKPTATEAKIVATPKYWKETLPNGLVILGTLIPEAKRINMSVNIKGGQLLEANGAYSSGVANMTAGMMNEGTQKYTAAEIEDEIEKLGSSIVFGAGTSSINGSVSSFKESFEPTLALFEQRLLYPNFDNKQFAKDKKAVLASFSSDKTSSSSMQSKGWAKIIYGDNSILGESASGNPSSISKMSTTDLANYHRNNISPNVTTIIITGNITKEEALEKLGFLKNWENKNVKLPTALGFPDYQTNQIFMIDNPSATQTQMMIGYRTIPYDAFGDFYKLNIANYALGGNFNSRINLSLREQYGWTYGARSGASAGVENIPGVFYVAAGIKRKSTDSAVRETMRILTEYNKDGITQEELDYAKKSLAAVDALRYESSFGKANYIYNIVDRNLPDDYRKKQTDILNGMTVDQVNEIIRKYIKPDEMIIFVVGNGFYIKDGVSDLGYGKPAMLSTDGSGKKKIKKKK